MKKVFMWLLVISMIAVFTLAGCKEEAAEEEVVTEEEVAEEEVAEVVDETSEWGNIDWRQFEGTELHGINFIMPIQEVYDNRLAEFEELTGIKVDFEYVDANSFAQKIIADFASGMGQYDVVSVGLSYREEYVAGNYLEDLNNYLNNPDLTDLEWYNLDDYPEDVLQGGISSTGVLVDIPYTAEYYLLWYLKDVFEQLNLKVPETWDEYVETAKALDDAREAGEITAYAHWDRLNATEAGWSMFCSASRQGINLMDFENNVALINSDKGREFMNWYTDWGINYGPPGSITWLWSELAQAFSQGQLAMTIGGNTSYYYVEDETTSEVAGNVGYAHPILKDGGKDPMWQWGWGLNSASKNKDAAWLFIQWATSPNLITKIAPEFACPARLSPYSDPVFLEAMPNQEFIDAEMWMLQNGTNSESPVFHKNFGEAQDIIARSLSEISLLKLA